MIHVAQSKAASEPADAIYAHLNTISALHFVNALGMPSEFLEQIVEHNITMDEVSLADQVSIPVIAKGAVVLSNRGMDELAGDPFFVNQPSDGRYVPYHF